MTHPMFAFLARISRHAARVEIIRAANAHRLSERPGAKRWGRRHIQRAVCVCRQNRLVGADILVAAGYNPTRTR